MADIHFLCPTCRHSLIVDESGGGMATDCPHCSSPVDVPNPPKHDLEYEERVLCAFLKSEEERLAGELGEAQRKIAELERTGSEPDEAMKLADELSAARSDTAALKADLERERSKTQKLKSRLGTLEGRLKAAESALDAESKRAVSLSKEREAAAKALAQGKAEAESGRKKADALDAEVRSLRRELETARTDAKEVAALREKLAAATSGGKERDDRIKSLRAELEARDATLSATRKSEKSLKETLAASEESVGRLGEEVAALGAGVESARADAASAYGRIANFEREAERRDAKLTATRDELATAQAEAETLRERVRHLEENRESIEEIETLRAALGAADAERRALGKEIEERGASLAGLSAKLRESRAAEDSLKAQIAGDAENLEALRDELAATEAALSESLRACKAAQDADADREALARKVEKAESLLAQVQSEAAAFAGEVHDLKSRVRVGESALTAANEKVRSLKEANARFDEEQRVLQRELTELRSKRDEGSHALEAERAKVRALAADLATAQSADPGAVEPPRNKADEERIAKLEGELNDAREALKKLDRALYSATTERDCFETMLNGLKSNFSEVSVRLASFEAWAEANGTEANGVWEQATREASAEVPAGQAKR